MLGVLALATSHFASAAESGPSWAALNAKERQSLAPLQPGWADLDAARKQKWREVAARLPQMPTEERQRVQQRMAAWSAMAPADRARARLQFQETRQIGAQERQARWQAYQALPEEERVRLAEAAKPLQPATTSTSVAPRTASAPKANLVTTTAAPAPKSVARNMVQARPGATTTTVATKAKPPLHHQPGLPKIVATPAFVDPATLLPRRGPQGAAMRTAASNDPTHQP